MSRPTWRPRAADRARAYVIRVFGRTCWLCGHSIRNTVSVDHVHPVATHPELEHEPTNWRPAHLHPAGRTDGCHITGCPCPGNTGRKAKPWTAPPSRDW